MCIAQYDTPEKESDPTMPPAAKFVVAESSGRFNPWLEGVSLLVSFAAFVLAIFLLLHAYRSNIVCLPFGCHAKAAYPVFYWITVLAYGLLALLSACVFGLGRKNLSQ